MQLPPLIFSDAILLLAIGAIILLITAELASPCGRTNLTINRKKLKNAGLAIGMLFLITVAIKIINIIIGV